MDFTSLIGPEVTDVDEEVFDLFAQTASMPDLGMIDPTAEEIDICIAGRDYTIKQSPGKLQSSRGSGTTGAAVWQTAVRFAELLAQPKPSFDRLELFKTSTRVLELGSGIAGIVACTLAESGCSILATDQAHLLKLMRENISTNATTRSGGKQGKNGKREGKTASAVGAITTAALDWEQDDVRSLLQSQGLDQGVDVIVASDCIFNYALIEPFVQTCVEACKIRQDQVRDYATSAHRPTTCLIAQHLRQAEVFEQWLTTFAQSFHVWRLPSDMLGDRLGAGSGFAVHVGILRNAD